MSEAQTGTWQATDRYQSAVLGSGTPDVGLLQKAQGGQMGGGCPLCRVSCFPSRKVYPAGRSRCLAFVTPVAPALRGPSKLTLWSTACSFIQGPSP